MPQPLVAHIIYRLDIGGLESVLVQYLNHCPAKKFRHVIICLTEFTSFKSRIRNQEVEVYALGKNEGKDFGIYLRMWKLLRKLKPAIVHTYNIATIDHQVTAFLAGVKHRVHAEHGRDFSDPDGTNRKYNLLRKILRPIIHYWVPVSQDLHNWLKNTIGVADTRNKLIYNGVDINIFFPQSCSRKELPENFRRDGLVIVGTVGRLDPVKDQTALIQAFTKVLEEIPDMKPYLKLIIIGDGPMKQKLKAVIEENKLNSFVWLAGARNDIPILLNCFDIFVLPSIAEGIPMTILEAMATGLPVIATDVGGTGEVIIDNQTGCLIPKSSGPALVEALKKYCTNKELMLLHGAAGTKISREQFSLRKMTAAYNNLYDTLISSSNYGH